MKTLNLNHLGEGEIPGVEQDFGNYMASCASYLLMHHNHNSGIPFVISMNGGSETVSITWRNKMSQSLKDSMNDHDRPSDFGAMGIAILTVLEFTEYKYFQTSKKGTGFDFWISKGPTDEYNFLANETQLGLEVSGIDKVNRGNTVENRVKKKKKRLEKHGYSSGTVYISVTEFSEPKSTFVAL